MFQEKSEPFEISFPQAARCANENNIGIEFQRKLGTGLFGGEGFIMQKLEGDGMAFVHAGGTLARRELQAGEVLKVDTGCIVAYTPNVDFILKYTYNINMCTAHTDKTLIKWLL